MNNVFVVAIDGPAGSGKSSVSKEGARRLGFSYLDTGAAYRALAWYVANEGIAAPAAGAPAGAAGADAGAETAAFDSAVVAALPGFDYRIGIDPDVYSVRVGETDVTEAIRDPRVSAGVSAIARIPAVRAFINDLFRSIIAGAPTAGIVVEGRDITTVVAPDAPVRILLTASEEVRAARRAGELTGEAAATAAEALHRRDRADSRVNDFLSAAEGVYTLDTTHLDFEQTVAAVLELVAARR